MMAIHLPKRRRGHRRHERHENRLRHSSRRRKRCSRRQARDQRKSTFSAPLTRDGRQLTRQRTTSGCSATSAASGAGASLPRHMTARTSLPLLARRRLPFGAPLPDDDEWTCAMNPDARRNTCEAEEEESDDERDDEATTHDTDDEMQARCEC